MPSGAISKRLERREALRPRDAVDEDVGRGADHGDHAAEHGLVGERDQQLRRREPHRVRELHRHRDHHRDERRVVGEGRGDGDEEADGRQHEHLVLRRRGARRAGRSC